MEDPLFGKPARNFAPRTIWTGDNLDILRGINSETVDLIYLDPPFNSNRTYSAPIGSKAAGAAFEDTWGLRAVNACMRVALAMMPRVRRVPPEACCRRVSAFLVNTGF